MESFPSTLWLSPPTEEKPVIYVHRQKHCSWQGHHKGSFEGIKSHDISLVELQVYNFSGRVTSAMTSEA